ncbi:MAG: protein kinase [Planctomycetes bacterium]|nr:protein kinase [Planctomycetota bacterium]
MSNVDKSLVAAVLAVRRGAIPPEQAAQILASARDASDALSRVESALGAGADEFEGGTVAISPSLVDVVAHRLDADGDLRDLGFDETTVRTLSEIRNMKAADPSVRDTLLSISPTRMVKDLDLDDMPLIDASEHTETSRPTVRPKESPSTKKPSSQILRAVARAERYTIEKEHARGGMGRILIARDNVIGREVALKELLPGRAPGASTPNYTDGSQGLTERFLREAKVTGQLEHPNIVSVYEIGKNDDDSLYYTMKFVRGQTLAARLSEIEKDVSLDKKEKLAARLKLLDNFVDVCNAIAYAHSKGVIHRDLKPENVMLGEYGETIVLDWGLARVRGQEDTVAQKLIDSTRYMSQSVVEHATDKLTLDGSIVGTPAYMSPEQARGDLEEIDEQSDVYALGAVLYQIISGRPPFDGPVAGLIIQQVLHAKPLRLSAAAPDCPPELEALAERAMAKDKSDRLQSAREFASEVKAFRDGRTLQSYSYSVRELVWRWVGRYKRAVIVGAIVFYGIIAGAVYHYAQLRQEKEQVEQQKTDADNARRQAELAFADARDAEKQARTAKDLAEEKEHSANLAVEAKEKALQGWNQTLADAYAMRIRLSVSQSDQNAALAFAAASLRSGEQPEARGTLLSSPDICPLLWRFAPDKPSIQELYQFFDVQFSADGRFVATGMADGRVWIWSIETGQTTQVLKMGKAVVHDVAFSPDGRWFVASDDDGLVRFWQYNPGGDKFEDSGLEFTVPKRARVNCIQFTPDGRNLICAGQSMMLYSMTERKLLGQFEGPQGHDPMYISISPDGKQVVSTSIQLSDFFVRIWDVAEGKFKRGLLDQTSLNEMFTAWSPDGSVIASSTVQGQIILRDGKTFKQLGMLTSHTSSVFGLAFSPDSKTLVSCSADSTVRLWDVATQQEKLVLSGFTDWVESVSFSPDGRSICARDSMGAVMVWELPEESTFVLRGHSGDVMDIRLSRDGKRFITAGWDGSVVVWDAKTHEQLKRFAPPLKQFFCADFLDDHRIVAAGADGVYVWDTETNQQLAHLFGGSYVTDLTVAADGKRFFIALYRSAHCVDTTTFEETFETTRHKQLVLGVRMSRDNALIATSSQGGDVLISKADTGDLIMGLKGSGGANYSLDFSPEAKFLAVACDNREVHVWDVAQHKVVQRLTGHEGLVFSVRFSPDGKLLFSGSQDRTVRVWDTSDWHCIAVLKGHSETVTRVAVRADGQTLLTGSQDDTVRLWPLGDLSMPRAEIDDLSYARTGLRVREKEFAVRMDPSWPQGVENHRALAALRVRRAGELNRFRGEFARRFEGFRYEDITNGEGKRVRRYFAPRAVDDTGRLVGPAQGSVNYAAWWAQQHPEWAPGLERAPIVTEVLAEGQALDLQLEVGDLIWSVDGKRVHDREELKQLLDQLAERDEYPVEIHRFVRDADGNPQPAKDANGNLLLDSEGDTMWDVQLLGVRFRPGKLGMRIGDGSVTLKPLR